MASNFASQMGNSSGFAPVKLSGLRIPGVGAARGVVVVAGEVLPAGGAVAGGVLAALGGALAALVVAVVDPSLAGSSGLVIVP